MCDGAATGPFLVELYLAIGNIQRYDANNDYTRF